MKFFRRWFWRWRLANYQWYRRWYGSVWERWIVDFPVCSTVWHDLEITTQERGERPGALCRGTPIVEDYR